MKTKAFHLALAFLLALALIPLAGCDRDGRKAVETGHDAQGRPTVHINGDEVQREAEHAGEQIDKGAQKVQEKVQEGAEKVGEQLQEGAQEAGAAIERGAKRVEERVGPVVQDVLDDASITARVKAKLVADPEVNSLHIDVDTLDGRVTLNGKVSSADQRAEAEKLARHTDGVRQVINLIQVAGQAPPAPPSGR
jgi:hyperosmotically inducible periplasmic protein